MPERTIAAVFREHLAADAALDGLLAIGIAHRDVSIAPAAIAEGDDGPIRQPVTIVAVTIPGDGSAVREVLELHGGRVVADVALSGEAAPSFATDAPAQDVAIAGLGANDELPLLPLDRAARRAPGFGLG